MSCMWVSVSECNQSSIYHLAQMIREDEELKIILSHGMPHLFDGENSSPSKRIERLLGKIGVPAHLKGYQYLKTALEMCGKDPEALEGITKRLYPDVARKHHTSMDRVEHAIRHSIEAAWKRGDADWQRRLFGYDSGERNRPTNMEFIVSLTEYLSREPVSYLS